MNEKDIKLEVNELRRELEFLLENNLLVHNREKQNDFMQRVRNELLEIFRYDPHPSNKTVMVDNYAEQRILVSAIEEFEQLIKDEEERWR